MKAKVWLVSMSIVSFLFSSSIIACTGLILKDSSNIILIKNHMNGPGIGYLMTNKRGVKKTAFVLPPETPMEWVSKYGSVTINEISKDLPNAGMNEAGLVIESTALEESIYPTKDKRYALNILQWIQYNLDNSKTVLDVIASDSIIRIEQKYTECHYIICDKNGNKALIEFLNGKMVYYLNDKFPIPVMANDTYKKSIQYIKQFIGFGGDKKIIIQDSIENRSSLESFIVGAKLVTNFETKQNPKNIDYVNSTLREKWSDWEVTYDTRLLTIKFKAYKNNDLKQMDLSTIDFNCDKTDYVLSFNEITNGNGNKHFVPYTTEINRELVKEIFSAYKFLHSVPNEFKEMLAIHPDKYICEEK